MIELSVDIEGMAEVRSLIKGAKGKAKRAVREVIVYYASLIAREARGNAAVDTGDLRSSIHIFLEDQAAKVIAGKSDVGTTEDYAIVVERGRADQPNYPIQPFLVPALETHRAGFIRAIKRAVSSGVQS